MQRGEPLVLETGERARERGDPAEVGHRRPPRGADALDRHVEQPLEPLLDELAHVVGQELARDRHSPLVGEPAEPDRRAPQRERVARAGRALAEPEDRHEPVELVRRGEDPAVGARGQRRVGGVGKVLLVDRPHDLVGPAGEARVLGADVPLEVGELADELGRLVGLRQPRRLDPVRPRPEALDEVDEPLRLVGERAGAGDVGDRPELRRERVDPLRDVAVEREAGVVEAVLEHRDVAGEDGRRVAAVGDDGEAVAAEREVALVRLHRRFDHAPRQPQEALVEGRVEHERALDQVHDLVELAERVAPVAVLGQPLLDRPPPLALVGLDAGRANRARVRPRALDRHGAVAEPVAVRRRSGGDSFELDRDGLVVQLRAEPAHRPREAERRPPAHRLPELEPAHDRGEPLRQRIPHVLAGHGHPEEAVALLQRLRLDAVPLREARRGLLPQRHGRALHPLVGRPFRQALDEDDEPPRPYPDLCRRPSELAPRRGRAAAPPPRGRHAPAAPRSRSRAAGQAADSTSR